MAGKAKAEKDGALPYLLSALEDIVADKKTCPYVRGQSASEVFSRAVNMLASELTGDKKVAAMMEQLQAEIAAHSHVCTDTTPPQPTRKRRPEPISFGRFNKLDSRGGSA